MSNLLEDPKIFDIITEDELAKRITGEIATRKAIFLSLCSIWVKDIQVNTLVNSESSSGKSYICKAIVDLFPEELKQYRTKISPEAFTYWHNSSKEPDWSWDGKICYLEDISQSLLDSPTFRVMCSEGSISTVVRNQLAIDIEIVGKPCMLLTTANTTPTKELLNRFNLISLDESCSQTLKILERTAEFAEESESVPYSPRISEALTRLRRIEVTIPFAKKIVKCFPTDDIRVRRDFKRFFDLIKASTALHQFQRSCNHREHKFAEAQDYELAKEALLTMQSDCAFGLTHQLKKAYQVCLEMHKLPEYKQGFSVKEVHTFAPIVSDRYWYINLNKLCQGGWLKTDFRKDPASDKKVTVYYPVKKAIINLPSFLELEENNSNGSIPSNANQGNEAIEQKEQEKSEKVEIIKIEDIGQNSNKDDITSITEDKNVSKEVD